MMSDKPRIPTRPTEWQSAVQLSRKYRGKPGSINKALSSLRLELAADLVDAGFHPEEAARCVEAHLVGWNALPIGRPALAASPDAVRQLDLRSKGDPAPLKPPGWRTVTELSADYRGGRAALVRKMQELRDALIADVRAGMMCDHDTAEQIVGDRLIGVRASGLEVAGTSVLAVSPEAIRIAVADGVLVRRGVGEVRPIEGRC